MGTIAKRTEATYSPGTRTRDWLKLKVEFRQEFVVGGYTEPRNSREHLGALLVGYYDDDRLIYAGHVGSVRRQGHSCDAVGATSSAGSIGKYLHPFRRPSENERSGALGRSLTSWSR